MQEREASAAKKDIPVSFEEQYLSCICTSGDFLVLPSSLNVVCKAVALCSTTFFCVRLKANLT